MRIDTQYASEKDIPWAPMGSDPRAEIRILQIDRKAGRIVMVNRYAPGFEAPKHRHAGAVYAYTLKGQWRYAEYDWVASAGDYVFEEPGTVHTLQTVGDVPVEILFVMDGALEIHDENNQLLMSVDISMFEGMYMQGLAAKGLAYPSAIIRSEV